MLLQTLDQKINALNNGLAYLSSILIWLMMLIMVTLVIMRYALNTGSIALQETATYLHAFILLMGVGYTLKADAHVRVDIIYRRLSQHTKTWINLWGTIFFLMPLAICVLCFSWDYVATAWANKEASGEAGGLPYLYLLKSLLIAFPAVLTLSAIEQVIIALRAILLEK